MSVSEAKEYVHEEDNQPVYIAKRVRLIEFIVDKGQNYRIDADDFEMEEQVETTDAAGDRRWRSGQLLRNNCFEERFTAAQRKKMNISMEKIPDAATGVMQDWVRVFDEEEGILKFDQYVENEAKHRKIVHNGKLKLDKD